MPPERGTPDPTAAWFAQARFGLFVHWGHGSQRGWELSWPLVGGAARACRHCQDVPAETYHANARSFAPRRGAARDWLAAREALRHALRRAHHEAPRRLRALADTRVRLLDRVDARTAATWSASSSRPRARPGSASDSTSRSCDWHHPDYPPFTDADRPYRFGLAPRPTDDAVGALPRPSCSRSSASCSTQLRPDRPALVRRRMGAHAGRVAHARAGGDDPRAPARTS